jgi:hypothetical protein
MNVIWRFTSSTFFGEAAVPPLPDPEDGDEESEVFNGAYFPWGPRPASCTPPELLALDAEDALEPIASKLSMSNFLKLDVLQSFRVSLFCFSFPFCFLLFWLLLFGCPKL